MNFLGMGPMELMMILVLALIVFGPGKLPEIAGQVGKVVRDFRRTTSELSSEFNRTLSLEVEERRATKTQAEAAVAEAVPYEAPPVPDAAPVVEAAAPPAVEPTEAPPATVGSTTVSTAAPASNGSEPAPAGASKRRTYDADLAPPY
jgi:TatA/E family protein of Tat protein translocase